MDSNRVRIWDLVVRWFHWLLAAAFAVAFAIATLSDDHGAIFPIHALIGMTVVFMVILRVLWGFIGTRWARFSSFDLRPSALFHYLRGALGGNQLTEHPGHNPATSWFVMASVVILLFLGLSGFMNARGYESAEEIHEVLAWTMVALAGIHVAGIAVATMRTRENVAASMISGVKKGDVLDDIGSARTGSAVLFLVLTAMWSGMLFFGYDRATGSLTVPVFGTTLQLSETENGAETSADDLEDED